MAVVSTVASAPRRREVIGRSRFLTRCRRRMTIGLVVAMAGLVATGALAARRGALWVVVTAVVVTVSRLAIAPLFLAPQFDVKTAPDTNRPFQEVVNAMARRARMRPPHVYVMPRGRRHAFGASVTPPPFIIVPEAEVGKPPAPVVSESSQAALAHELGHHLFRTYSAAIGVLARLPLMIAFLALFTRDPRTWALLALAAVVLVGVPSRWASRWNERAADEVARQLGYGDALVRFFRDVEAGQRSVRRRVRHTVWAGPGWWRSHPSLASRIRLLGRHGATDERVHLHLPRVRARATADLAGPLRALGIAGVFDRRALTRVVEGHPVALAGAFQGAVLDVAEGGIDGARAAHGVGHAVVYRDLHEVDVRVDRPFFLLLTDAASGAVYLAGHISEPGGPPDPGRRQAPRYVTAPA